MRGTGVGGQTPAVAARARERLQTSDIEEREINERERDTMARVYF